jgi:3-oxoadipate enol-lactonase
MSTQQTSRRSLMAFGAAAVAPHVVYAAANNRHTQSEDAMHKHQARPGVEIAYADEWFGAPWLTGEPIVLLHGVAESHVAWQQWMPVLSGRYRVIRPDLPGFGESPMPAAYSCTTHQVAGDIARFLDGIGVGRFHLVGAKIGGSTALQFAADYPDRVRTLCVFGTPAKGATGGKANLSTFPAMIRKEGVRGWAAATMRSRLGSDASPEMMTWWTDDLMGKATPQACIGYSGAVDAMNLEPILGKITAPTLVVTTEGSPLQPVSSARAYQEKIPKSKLLVLPGDSYHIAAVKPVECANQVLQFITST